MLRKSVSTQQSISFCFSCCAPPCCTLVSSHLLCHLLSLYVHLNILGIVSQSVGTCFSTLQVVLCPHSMPTNIIKRRTRRGGTRQRVREVENDEATQEKAQSAVAALLMKMHLLGSMSPHLVQVVASAVMLDIRQATFLGITINC